MRGFSMADTDNEFNWFVQLQWIAVSESIEKTPGWIIKSDWSDIVGDVKQCR